MFMSIGHFTPRKSGKQSQKNDPLRSSQDATWLSSIPQSDLDLMVSLKQLVIMRSKLADHRDLADKFDVRMLRALGTAVIILKHVREKLKRIPSRTMAAYLIDKLPFLITVVVNVNLDNQTPSFGTLKRKHFHDGLRDTVAGSPKKQKVTVKEEQ